MHFSLVLASAAVAFAAPKADPSFASFFTQRNFQGPSFPVSDFACHNFTAQYQNKVQSFAINDGYTCTLFSALDCKGNAPYYYYGDFVTFDGSQAVSVKCASRSLKNDFGALPFH